VFTTCPWSVGLLLMFASACGGSGTPTGPSFGALPIPASLGNEVLNGQVTDRTTSAPLSGAAVVFSQSHSPYATTDSSGNYSLIGLPAPGGGALVWATAEGVMTVEALPIGGGVRPPLIVAVGAGNRLLVERLGNPVSVQLTGGTEVIAFIEMSSSSTTTQSFTLTTSMAPR
jgi:Carboxypeptidase regulatory-like domain